MNTRLEHAIVGCLVKKEGKFLVVEESRPGRQGLYNLPSGHVEGNETLAEAAIREVEEETGYKVRLKGFLGIYQSIYSGSINVSGPVFLAQVIGGELRRSDEHPNVRWVTANELLAMAKQGEFWTKYPPLAIRDYERRGSFPMELVSSVIY